MTTINQQFIDYQSIVPAAWLNNVNDVVNGFVDPQTYGAIGNGVFDNTGAFASASSFATSNGGMITLAPGMYKVNNNITFNSPVYIQPGATILITTSAQITFNKGVYAGIYQIFNITGTGSIIVNPGYTRVGYAEWWGAVPTVVVNGNIVNGIADCSPAINACIQACSVTQLMPGIYHTQQTIYQNVIERSVIGAGNGMAVSAGAVGTTTISLDEATGTIWQIGVSAGTTATTSSSLKNVMLLRSVAPVITDNSNCGLFLRYTAWTEISGVSIFDCRFGVHILGASTTRMDYVNIYRTLAGTGGSGGTTDQFYGFLLDSSGNQGLPDSGIASTTIQNCTVTATALTQFTWSSTWDFQGIVAGNPLGGTDYGIADFWVDTFETNGLGVGIQLLGDSVTGPTLDGYKNHDIRFRNLVLDANAVSGIIFKNISVFGAIQVSDSYINNHPLGTNPTGILYLNSHGAIKVHGLEYVGSTNPTGIAILASGSSGMMHKNNVYFECGVSPIQLGGCFNCIFEDMGRQFSTTMGHPLVQIGTSSTNCVFRCLLSGLSNAYTYGYQLIDGTVSNCEFNCSGLNAGSITPSPGKINNNGTVITTQGIFGTNNLASGLVT